MAEQITPEPTQEETLLKNNGEQEVTVWHPRGYPNVTFTILPEGEYTPLTIANMTEEQRASLEALYEALRLREHNFHHPTGSTSTPENQ